MMEILWNAILWRNFTILWRNKTKQQVIERISSVELVSLSISLLFPNENKLLSLLLERLMFNLIHSVKLSYNELHGVSEICLLL